MIEYNRFCLNQVIIKTHFKHNMQFIRLNPYSTGGIWSALPPSNPSAHGDLLRIPPHRTLQAATGIHAPSRILCIKK